MGLANQSRARLAQSCSRSKNVMPKWASQEMSHVEGSAQPVDKQHGHHRSVREYCLVNSLFLRNSAGQILPGHSGYHLDVHGNSLYCCRDQRRSRMRRRLR